MNPSESPPRGDYRTYKERLAAVKKDNAAATSCSVYKGSGRKYHADSDTDDDDASGDDVWFTLPELLLIFAACWVMVELCLPCGFM